MEAGTSIQGSIRLSGPEPCSSFKRKQQGNCCGGWRLISLGSWTCGITYTTAVFRATQSFYKTVRKERKGSQSWCETPARIQGALLRDGWWISKELLSQDLWAAEHGWCFSQYLPQTIWCEVDEVFFNQQEESLRLQALVLMGEFNHPNTSCRYCKAYPGVFLSVLMMNSWHSSWHLHSQTLLCAEGLRQMTQVPSQRFCNSLTEGDA